MRSLGLTPSDGQALHRNETNAHRQWHQASMLLLLLLSSLRHCLDVMRDDGLLGFTRSDGQALNMCRNEINAHGQWCQASVLWLLLLLSSLLRHCLDVVMMVCSDSHGVSDRLFSAHQARNQGVASPLTCAPVSMSCQSMVCSCFHGWNMESQRGAAHGYSVIFWVAF